LARTSPSMTTRGDDRGDATDDISRTISVLESAVATLRDQLAVANRRADRAEAACAEFWSRSRFARLRAVWGRGG
jgi:hypothetical protein